MIQRVQTIYLLLSGIALAISAIFEKVFFLQCLSGAMALACFGLVFVYGNRPLQAKLCVVLMGLGIVYYIALAILQPVLDWYAAMPMVGLLFLFLARKSIVKDEKLVRSLDRIR